MFDAQLLMSDGTNNAVYSPWFPRGGDHAKFFFEVLAIDATNLIVTVFTKNSEDPGDGTNTTTSATQSAVGIKEIDASSTDLVV